MLTRRKALVMALGSIAAAAVPMSAFAAIDEAIAAFTGGAEVGEGGGLTLTAPEIAENGNTVPISVDAPGAAEIIVLSTGNPQPEVCTFKFGPAAGSQAASTRMRLAKTQDVVAIAKMPDGTFIRAAAAVKVTIGGCGG